MFRSLVDDIETMRQTKKHSIFKKIEPTMAIPSHWRLVKISVFPTTSFQREVICFSWCIASEFITQVYKRFFKMWTKISSDWTDVGHKIYDHDIVENLKQSGPTAISKELEEVSICCAQDRLRSLQRAEQSFDFPKGSIHRIMQNTLCTVSYKLHIFQKFKNKFVQHGLLWLAGAPKIFEWIHLFWIT